MPQNFYPVNRDQLFLMPPSLQDWLPGDHLAYFIIDAVQQMNLEPFYAKYRADGIGHAAYEPSMMVSLLLYSYCLGERSSRQIERLCEVDVAYRIITANLQPDHSAIARFRQHNEKELEGLFLDVLILCHKAGMVRLGVVAIDGSKIKANASLAANRTYEGLEKEVRKILGEARDTDEREDEQYGPDKRGDELPPDLADPRKRLARLQECKNRLEEEAAQAAAAQKRKIEEREKEEEETGKKRRGRKPKEPQEEPEETAKANVTDPESRIMKTRSGYVQGYNAQAVVTEEQIIIAADVTQQENDVHQLRPMLENAKETLIAAGIEEKMVAATADAGYCSEENLVDKRDDDPEMFINTEKEYKQRQASRNNEKAPRGRIPANLPPRERMKRKVNTQRGRRIYRKRGMTVEPVFGQIKNRGCDRFSRRGLDASKSEWCLFCATGNLLKLYRKVAGDIKKGVASFTGGAIQTVTVAR
jgi:transposase